MKALSCPGQHGPDNHRFFLHSIRTVKGRPFPQVRMVFIKPCLPSKVARPPSGPLWVQRNQPRGYRAGAYRGYRYGVGAGAVGAAAVGAAAAGGLLPRWLRLRNAYGNWVCPPY